MKDFLDDDTDKEKDNETKKRKYRDVDQNMEDDNSLSTTDLDHLELLKMNKNRKLAKQNKRQQLNSFARHILAEV